MPNVQCGIMYHVALAHTHRKHTCKNNNNNTKKQETEKPAADADAGECDRGRACRDVDVRVFSVLEGEGGRGRRGGFEIPHDTFLL